MYQSNRGSDASSVRAFRRWHLESAIIGPWSCRDTCPQAQANLAVPVQSGRAGCDSCSLSRCVEQEHSLVEHVDAGASPIMTPRRQMKDVWKYCRSHTALKPLHEQLLQTTAEHSRPGMLQPASPSKASTTHAVDQLMRHLNGTMDHDLTSTIINTGIVSILCAAAHKNATCAIHVEGDLT